MIVIFTGFTTTGKSTYLEQILKVKPEYKRLVTYTTRPIRSNEINGSQYHFITTEEFKELMDRDKIISARSYKTIERGKETIWRYGLGKDFIKNKDEVYLTIVDPVGALSLIAEYGQDNVKIIYFYADEIVLYNRAAHRGDEPAEFMRRLESDKEQLPKINGYIGLRIDTNADEEKQKNNLQDILKYIGG